MLITGNPPGDFINGCLNKSDGTAIYIIKKAEKMITERYIINFYSIGDKRFGIEEVKRIWINAAIKENERCGVFNKRRD